MKCPKCVVDMKMLDNTVDLGDTSVMVHFRCETCWTAFSFIYSQPAEMERQYAPLELFSCSGRSEERWTYYKCSTPTAETYTNVAKRKYANRERLEAMGFKVEESEGTLPAYRLYELR